VAPNLMAALAGLGRLNERLDHVEGMMKAYGKRAEAR